MLYSIPWVILVKKNHLKECCGKIAYSKNQTGNDMLISSFDMISLHIVTKYVSNRQINQVNQIKKFRILPF
jgi:hypothetical protein